MAQLSTNAPPVTAGCTSTIRLRLKNAFFSIYSFAVIFALFGIGSSSFNALFTSSLSTLEKRYRFPSSSGGYTMITDNIATVMTSLFIGYHGRKAHKPRWMAAACLITGLSVALTALPYFIFGPPSSREIEVVRNLTATESTIRTKNFQYQMCDADPLITTSSTSKLQCDVQTMRDDAYVTFVALTCFALSNFMRGFGTSIFFTYGSPYLDDNVSKSQMPIIFACIFASRLFGAPMGLLMSSFALQYYENPLSPPSDLTKADPAWIGAWWLGFVIFGSVLMLLSIPLSFFPREFKIKSGKASNEVELEGKVEQESEPTTKQELAQEIQVAPLEIEPSPVKNSNVQDSMKLEMKEKTSQGFCKDVEFAKTNDKDETNMPRELWALIRNPLIVCQLIGNMFRGIGLLGFYVFQTKYIENEFSQTASKASFITGTTGFPAKIAGVLAGGLIISAIKPGPRTLTSYLFLIEISSIFALILASTFMGPTIIYPNTHINLATNQLDLTDQCNVACKCENVRYQPVCDVDEPARTYFSPCHAGCRQSLSEADDPSEPNFTDCSCTKGITLRKCQPNPRNQVQSYAWVVATAGMISGSARTGNTITLLRSIRPDQKAMAVALSSFWHSLAVSIPYPILYGKLFDWSCMFWRRECSRKGNCWLYDTERLRINYHHVTIGFIMLGSLFDLIMIFLSPRLGPLYDDDKKSLLGRCWARYANWFEKHFGEDLNPADGGPPRRRMRFSRFSL